MNMKRRISTVITALALVVALVLPFFADPFRVGQITMVLIVAIAVMGLAMLTRFTGQVSVGHSAFFGLGAYVTAISTSAGWPLVAGFVAGIACGAVLGLIIGFPSVRIRGTHLALVTLILAAAFPATVKRLEAWTGGSMGIRSPRIDILSSVLEADQSRYFVILAAFLLASIAMISLSRSSFGRELKAIGDNELAAITIGIRPYRRRVLIFTASAAMTSCAGSLFVATFGYISPSTGYVTVLGSVMLLVALVIGGQWLVWGPLLGAAAIELIPASVGADFPEFAHLVFALVLLGVLFASEGGLARLSSAVRRHFPQTGLRSAKAHIDPPKGNNERKMQ